MQVPHLLCQPIPTRSHPHWRPPVAETAHEWIVVSHLVEISMINGCWALSRNEFEESHLEKGKRKLGQLIPLPSHVEAIRLAVARCSPLRRSGKHRTGTWDYAVLCSLARRLAGPMSGRLPWVADSGCQSTPPSSGPNN